MGCGDLVPVGNRADTEDCALKRAPIVHREEQAIRDQTLRLARFYGYKCPADRASPSVSSQRQNLYRSTETSPIPNASSNRNNGFNAIYRSQVFRT